MYVSIVGDFVYVRSDQDLPFIARIDQMWTDSKSECVYTLIMSLLLLSLLVMTHGSVGLGS